VTEQVQCCDADGTCVIEGKDKTLGRVSSPQPTRGSKETLCRHTYA